MISNALLTWKGEEGWQVDDVHTQKQSSTSKAHSHIPTANALQDILPSKTVATKGKAEDNFPEMFKPLSPPTQGSRVWASSANLESRSRFLNRNLMVRSVDKDSDAATLMFVENRRAFSVHMFHFCEFLMLAHGVASQMLPGGADSVKCILFPNFQVTWRGAFHDFNVKLLEAVFPNARGRVLDRAHLKNAKPVFAQKMAIVDMQRPDTGCSNKLWYSFTRKEGDGESPRNGLCPDTTSDLLRRVRLHFNIATRRPFGQGRRPRVGVIRRGGVRKLSAEQFEDLMNALRIGCGRVAADVEEVRYETLSLEEQLQKDAQFDVLVGVHGAGLTHGLFMDRGSLIVEIMPEGARDWCYQMVAHVSGHEHACWFGNEGFVHRPWQTSSCSEATRDVNHGATCNPVAIADRVVAFIRKRMNG